VSFAPGAPSLRRKERDGRKLSAEILRNATDPTRALGSLCLSLEELRATEYELRTNHDGMLWKPNDLYYGLKTFTKQALPSNETEAWWSPPNVRTNECTMCQ